jgi:hypothetical protein
MESPEIVPLTGARLASNPRPVYRSGHLSMRRFSGMDLCREVQGNGGAIVQLHALRKAYIQERPASDACLP